MARKSRSIGQFPALLFVLVFFYPNICLAESLLSSDFKLSPTTFSSGGARISTVHYTTESSISQVHGTLTTSVYNDIVLLSGFWHLLTPIIGAGDINGDGTIDIRDIITGLQIITNSSQAAVYKEADIDGDGKIGFAEIIDILQSSSESDE